MALMEGCQGTPPPTPPVALLAVWRLGTATSWQALPAWPAIRSLFGTTFRMVAVSFNLMMTMKNGVLTLMWSLRRMKSQRKLVLGKILMCRIQTTMMMCTAGKMMM
jgi:hypothetical protein